MLVLSRRTNEKVVFPTSGVVVHVLEAKRHCVRLGFQAPPEVEVLRGEVADRRAEWEPPAAAPSPVRGADLDRLVRAVDNRLRIAGTGLELLHGQIAAGDAEGALATAEGLAEDLRLLRGRLATAAGPAPAAARPGKALLVEDNANERELLARFLRMSGFEVDTAGDGVDALDYLRARGRPDVVLLDMGLPRCDGPTTVRSIRSDRGLAGLKVFAVSAAAEEAYGLGRGPGGIDRWFRKPVNPAVLVRQMQEVLGHCPTP